MTHTCTLYVVRHGETEWNVKRLLQGHADSPLTEKGIQQAKDKGRYFQDVRFDAVFSSDSSRAEHTAQYIMQDKKIVVQTTKILRERAFGRFEGKHVSEYQSELRDLLEERNKLTDEQQWSFRVCEGIETDEELVTRFIAFLRETAIAYSGKTVLIVTHTAMIRTLLVRLGYAKQKELPPSSITNLAHCVIQSDGVEFEIKETAGITKIAV